MQSIYHHYKLQAQRLAQDISRKSFTREFLYNNYIDLLESLSERGLHVLLQSDTILQGFHTSALISGGENRSPTNATAFCDTLLSPYYVNGRVLIGKSGTRCPKYESLTIDTDALAEDTALDHLDFREAGNSFATLEAVLRNARCHVLHDHSREFRRGDVAIPAGMVIGASMPVAQLTLRALRNHQLSHYVAKGAWYETH